MKTERADEFIERQIIIGMLVSSDFLEGILGTYKPNYLASQSARILAGWCMDYFKKYNKAPQTNIMKIYAKKVDSLSKDKAEAIEAILQGLSDEYDPDGFNHKYITDLAKEHFKKMQLLAMTEEIQDSLEKGDIVAAELTAASYTQHNEDDTVHCINPFRAKTVVKGAFEATKQPLFGYPGALGYFINDQFQPGRLISYQAPEKSGKTFLLLDNAIRAIKNKCKVAFFQAGDMTAEDQLKRIGIYLTRTSDLKKYCGELYIPRPDCVYNQNDTCEKQERTCSSGPFEGMEVQEIRQMDFEELTQAFEDNPDHKPCKACKQYKGCTWFRKKEKTRPLDWKTAYKAMAKFDTRYPNRMKLITYSNEKLNIKTIRDHLETWRLKENWVPNVVIVDYVDILADDVDTLREDQRTKINKRWQRMKAMAQDYKCVVITATQAASTSYGKDTQHLGDFSEDKRKYSHVDGMYGINMTSREKQIGLMRLNQLLSRTGTSDHHQMVTILQRLEEGRPVLGSFR